MLFAAKLQAGERTRITALVSGTLVLTNVTLQEGSVQAKLYLQANEDEEMLVVALADPKLTAYHTEVRLSLSKRGRQTLVSRNGSVHLLGHFIPDDQEMKKEPIDEVLSVKRGDSARQSKSSKPQAESSEQVRRESTKVEPKQKTEEANDAPTRKSTRVRTPAPPPRSQGKSKKQAKIKSGSKGNSLLDMMYNLGDDDDEDESEYSEQEDSSSSSSSSSDEDSGETPKKSSKKQAKQQKVQRKGEDDRSSSIPSHVLAKIQAKSSSEHNRSSKQRESKASQQPQALKQSAREGLDTSNAQLEREIQSSLTAVATRLLDKVMKELPPPPTRSSSRKSSDDSPNAASSKASEEAVWLDKYLKFIAILQDKIQSFSLKDQEEHSQQQKELLADNQRLRQEVKALKGGSSRKEGRRGGEDQEERPRHKKDVRKDQSPFPYHIPTQIPDFMLKK